MNKGIGMIGVDEEFFYAISKKHFPLKDMCEIISEFGEPIIFASDRKESKLAKKLASMFNAKLMNPQRNLTNKEKRILIKNVGIKPKNQHEKDALAAAMYARNNILRLFKKIDNVLEKKNIQHIEGDVKEMVVKGRASNICQAIEMVTSK